MIDSIKIRVGKSLAAVAGLLLASTSAWSDTVDQGNIATFADGQPAVAGDVNGNFNELISQINDHASRLNDVEFNGVVKGDSTVSVDCGVDGPDALHDVINDSNNATGVLTVFATGACSEVAVFRRGVLLVGTDLSITADSGNARAEGAALQVVASDFRMIAGGGSKNANTLF